MSERINGLIGYFHLEDWWLTEFTDDERQHIEATFQPLGFGSGTLTQGKIYKTSETAPELLRALAGWFRKTEQDLAIAGKLREKAEQLKSKTAKQGEEK